MESFAYALEQSRCSVSYNGNLFSAADASALMEEIVGQDEPSDKGEMQKKTKLAALMFGRGTESAILDSSPILPAIPRSPPDRLCRNHVRRPEYFV